MTGRYIIRKLPPNSIFEFRKQVNGRIPNAQLFKSAFPDITSVLQIRPKAASFARGPQTKYVVLYENKRSVRCFFFFTLTTHPNDKIVLDICRCVGSRAVKRHWKTVIPFINNYKDGLKHLSDDQSLEFYNFKD